MLHVGVQRMSNIGSLYLAEVLTLFVAYEHQIVCEWLEKWHKIL